MIIINSITNTDKITGKISIKIIRIIMAIRIIITRKIIIRIILIRIIVMIDTNNNNNKGTVTIKVPIQVLINILTEAWIRCNYTKKGNINYKNNQIEINMQNHGDKNNHHTKKHGNKNQHTKNNGIKNQKIIFLKINLKIMLCGVLKVRLFQEQVLLLI